MIGLIACARSRKEGREAAQRARAPRWSRQRRENEGDCDEVMSILEVAQRDYFRIGRDSTNGTPRAVDGTSCVDGMSPRAVGIAPARAKRAGRTGLRERQAKQS